MKKLGLILLAGVLSLGTFAQTEDRSPAQKKAKKERVKKDLKPVAEIADKRTKQLTKKLELTEEQSGKVNAIITDGITQKRAIKAKAKKEKEARKAKLKALRESKKTEMEAVLTTEQMVKLEELATARKAKKEAKREQMRG